MPHDKNGKLIEVGDIVKTVPANHNVENVIGTVSQITESQACTGQVCFQIMGGLEKDYFDADNSELLLKANGTNPK